MQRYLRFLSFLNPCWAGVLLFVPQRTEAQDVHQSAAFAVCSDYKELEEKLEGLGDTLVVVNFWATWCKPCVRELPYFQALDSHFEGSGAKVLLVSLDLPKDLDVKLRPFAEDWDISSLVVALTDTDHNKWIPKVHEDWTGAIPATWVRKGGVRLFHEGEFDDWDSLLEFVNSADH